MVTTRYELIKELTNLTKLVASGIVPLGVSVKLQIYENYLDELKKNKKPVAITFTADKFGICENYVYRVINFMEK